MHLLGDKKGQRTMRQFLAMLGLLFVLAVGVAGGLALSHYYGLDEKVFEVLENDITPSVQNTSHVWLNALKR